MKCLYLVLVYILYSYLYKPYKHIRVQDKFIECSFRFIRMMMIITNNRKVAAKLVRAVIIMEI